MKLHQMAVMAEELPDKVFSVGAEFIQAASNLRDAAHLVVQSEGSYDLENLADAIQELDDA